MDNSPAQPDPETSQPDADEEEDATSLLFAKAQSLMDRITASPETPNPAVLHAIASLLETQELKYKEVTAHSSINNVRASHDIGRLGTLLRDNDEFFELISSKFLSEPRYTTPVQAATVRILLSCSMTWMYPHIFEESVLENIKNWVVDDCSRTSGENYNWKQDPGSQKASDFDMLKTYCTGLLAVCLTNGGQIVEDVLTSGLAAKLMRYLRNRILGDPSTSQKSSAYLSESKNLSGISCIKGREEGRGRPRQISGAAPSEDVRDVDRSLDNRGSERDHDNSIGRGVAGEACGTEGGAPPDGVAGHLDVCEVDEDRFHVHGSHGGKTRIEDSDENGRVDSVRRRGNRGSGRFKGKGKIKEENTDNEVGLISPGSVNRSVQQGQCDRDKSLLISSDSMKRFPDVIKSDRFDAVDNVLEREANDDCFRDCKIGSKDISDMVKKAVRAAEAEARTANAPTEAIRAAGDAAAEAVKSAAFEEFKVNNDEEAAVMAASNAASMVIDAAYTIVSRSSSSTDADSGGKDPKESEKNEEVEDYFIPEVESLAKLREKFCIQCLELLGEYVEVLGPVLHEKGVDVCIALLQKNSMLKEPSELAMVLPDVLKLICALAAHRKFAAMFVDREGIQKLLAVPRVDQTFLGLSSCIFAIGSLQGIMERVCALPTEVVHKVVELALQLLECPQDQARKNVALFFTAAFVFRAVLDCFDAQGGLQKLLSLLGDAASVRSGVNPGMLGPANTGPLHNERSSSEVLTAPEKQIAFHTCVALRQYFRAHLLLLVDSLRPNKNNRVSSRNIPSLRAPYKPLDISNESMDAVFLQLHKDRKLGPAFVRSQWPVVEKFLLHNGHVVMLELCQAPPGDRYLHDLLQYALGVLHIVTLVPNRRRQIFNAQLSNDRVGIAVILDAANCGSDVEPEIIQPALSVLVNLVCPPPSISYKPALVAQGQQSAAVQMTGGSETREKNTERNISDRAVSGQSEVKERNAESATTDRGSSAPLGAPSAPQTPVPSGLVGDRRISLGVGAGSAGLAAQLEQEYSQAREAVRTNNGIKVLLHLLQPRVCTPPAALDCLRALACRVLLGLARDDTIAHILTKLQVGKKLSELIRDPGTQTSGSEQGRWQSELVQAAIELMGIVTNSGRASTLAASDAATPTLRRIERAAIAAATPITYHSRELLLLIHEHLQASGLATTAATLLKEAQLTPLPSLAPASSLAHQSRVEEITPKQIQWPSGRAPCGFLSNKSKPTQRDEDLSLTCVSAQSSCKRKTLVFSASLSFQARNQPRSHDAATSNSKVIGTSKTPLVTANLVEPSSPTLLKPNQYTESQLKTPLLLPMKRKLTELKDSASPSSGKRLNTSDHRFRSPNLLTPASNNFRKSSLLSDAAGFSTPRPAILGPHNKASDSNDDGQSHIGQVKPFQLGFPNDSVSGITERLTLDSLVIQYLKHQHRQCPAPITTLPPLSLLHPHVCPEPKRTLDAPSNITPRLGTREFRSMYGGIHGNRRDRHFVYSRFRPWRTCRDDGGALFTCAAFLEGSSQIAVGSHSGELKIFDFNNSNVVESFTSHQSSLTRVQSHISGETQLLLSSSIDDVRLWDATSISVGPMRSFEGCKAARFSNDATVFAALSTEPNRREILLYDIQTGNLEQKLSDTSVGSSSKGLGYSLIHFTPSDSMLLWNGVLWDRRVSKYIHRFDQFSDYGGGGFHPAGNEVIINSEVWDLRKFRLLRSVSSLDQTVLTFNARGDVIYAILRRLDDIHSAIHTRRSKHPLFAAFRTIDAVNYSEIATIPVDRCVLDLATESTDSFVSLVTMDDPDEVYSSARIYEIGRRRPTDDDSDPDDAESDQEEEDDDDVDEEDSLLDADIDGDSDMDADDMSDDDDDDVGSDDLDENEDEEFMMDGVDFDGGGGILEFVTEDEEDDSDGVEFGSDDEEEDYGGL